MQRRDFLRFSAGAAASFAARGAGGKKPNILVILADDMGFADAGCYGSDIDTPNLDKLAANGLRFTQMYSTARCGPSRSCLMTGYYAQQTACDVMTPGNVPEWTKFAPEHMKPLGYRAYHSGKWHIRFKPLAGTGFDRSYTALDLNRYFTPRQRLLNDEPMPVVKPSDNYYSTIAIASYAVDFLKEHQQKYADQPFYFYLAFNAPHLPMQALQEDIDKYKGKFSEGWDVNRGKRYQRMRKMGLINCALAPMQPEVWPPWNTSDEELLKLEGPGEATRAVPWASLTPEQKDFNRTKMAIHAAMITRMDHEIGRILDQVRSMNAMEDTLIMFLSDNGASAEILIRGDGHDKNAPPGSAATHMGLGPGWSTAGNTPFRMHKSWVHEGGISSPCIVHWPKGIADKGKLRHDVCHFIDVVPTAIELAGGDPKKTDLPGKSMLAAFKKDGTISREFLYFNHNNNRAIRSGDWKAVAVGKDGPWELYNLKTDRCEQKNLASAQPDRVKQLAATWDRTTADHQRVREAAVPSKRSRMAMGAGGGG